MGLAGARAGVPSSFSTKVHIVALHPDNKIATAMMEEEGGGSSTTMVVADNARGRGGRCLSCCPWQVDVVLPSSALPLFRDKVV